MPISRYRRLNPVINKNEMYASELKKKGLKHILQYKTLQLKYPTKEQIKELDVVNHTWRAGDKYYKLAYKHYGDVTLWWLIAWFNQVPVDCQLTIGQIVYIPLPLEKVMMMFEG